MSKVLNRLFDYQRFEGNQELQQVIDSVHSRYTARELELDDMETVYAAGNPVLPKKPEKQEK